MSFRVEKRDYSRGAWRVLDSDGEQVWRKEQIDHSTLGVITVDGPVCFERKRDALAWVAEQEGERTDGRFRDDPREV